VAIDPAKPKAIQAAAPAANNATKGPCYNCHKMGQFPKECPYPKRQQPTYPGRVHHTSIEEIPKGEPVTAGMFPINQHLAVVLFDSGSSHSLMSQAFAQKHEQPVTELGYGYRISNRSYLGYQWLEVSRKPCGHARAGFGCHHWNE